MLKTDEQLHEELEFLRARKRFRGETEERARKRQSIKQEIARLKGKRGTIKWKDIKESARRLGMSAKQVFGSIGKTLGSAGGGLSIPQRRKSYSKGKKGRKARRRHYQNNGYNFGLGGMGGLPSFNQKQFEKSILG